MSTDRERPRPKIVPRRQVARPKKAHSKKWRAAGCYLPSKWSGLSGRGLRYARTRAISTTHGYAAAREAMIEDLWPELVYKLPPKKSQG
jgi:hypothetical protein